MNRTWARSGIAAVSVLVLGITAAPRVQTQVSTSGQPTHVQLTRDEDFERTRRLLGITGPPPAGASGSAPETFDESKANPYPNLPDPLTLSNGQRVTTAAVWNSQRRPELLELFEREVYGRTPKQTPAVTWEVLSTVREMNGAVPVVTKQLVGRVDNSAYPALTVNIRASVSTPADATGPVPVILSFGAAGFGGGRGGAAPAPDPDAPAPTTVCVPTNAPPAPAPAARGAQPPAGRAGGPAAGRAGQTGPQAPPPPTSQQQALELGWGYATVLTNSVQADNGQGLTCGIIGLVNKGQPRQLDDWGVLAAWAWGASRVLDYFESDAAVDATRIGMYGHSRWGYATVLTNSVQADNGQGLTCGIIGLVNKGQPRQLDDWGVLAAWAWGASRVLDYFESDAAVDATRIGMYGHSRWGKATLLAAVLDPRFAIAYVSSSGQGGAKLHRRAYGETVDNVANTFYYWMGANYIKYAGNWDAMPVDSHQLVALMAPRPVFFSAGNDPQRNPDGTIATRVNEQGQTVVTQAYDAWVDPRGTFMAAAAAAPVYELLGRKGLGVSAFPAVDTKVISGDLGFHQHPGGHTSGPAWETFYTFAARHFTR